VRIAILGAGALASAVAGKLAPQVVVWSRRPAQARALVRGRRGLRAAASLEHAVAEADVVLLAVPDGTIAGLARTLARHRSSWQGVAVLHTAGAFGPELLSALSRRGAAAGVLHPMAALGARGAGLLEGASVRIEGNAAAVAAARKIARRLGLVPLRIAVSAGANGRAAYHAAASLVSNDFVALVAAARDLLTGAGVPAQEASRALIELAGGALATVRRHGIAASLSGPVVRGDAKTLAAQLKALDTTDPLLAAAHRALSLRLVDVAVAAGRLDARSAKALRNGLSRGRRRPATV
jgi:predicted short-subunit dehydrogenase-like oxidoreductase (DUF2520 family)